MGKGYRVRLIRLRPFPLTVWCYGEVWKKEVSANGLTTVFPAPSSQNCSSGILYASCLFC